MTDSDGPNHHRYRTESWLSETYYDRGWSVREMASDAGVDERTIRRNMDQYGLERGSRGSGLYGLSSRLADADPDEVRASD